MKNYVLVLIASCCVFACKQNCDQPVAIQNIQPAANPVGYEVFIAASGVSAASKVTFDAVEATSVKAAEGGLIVKVPAGVAGPVTLSVEAGDCNASKSFEVLGAYPGNTPASPTSIIVPQTPSSYPSDITNAPWINAFDTHHKLFLVDSQNPPGKLIGSSEAHDSLDYFIGNAVEGNVTIATNTIFITIDRTSQPGGFKDTLTGQFIPNLPQHAASEGTMLLTSKRTGRQLVFYKQY